MPVHQYPRLFQLVQQAHHGIEADGCMHRDRCHARAAIRDHIQGSDEIAGLAVLRINTGRRKGFGTRSPCDADLADIGMSHQRARRRGELLSSGSRTGSG